MISSIAQSSLAAGAAATNVIPSSFNPIPYDGFLEIFGVTDFVAGLTALPTIQVLIGQGAGGGGAPANPVLTSVIPGAVASVTGSFQGPDLRNLLMPRTAVRAAQQIQVLLAGGAGATAIVRLMIRLMLPEEAAAAATAF